MRARLFLFAFLLPVLMGAPGCFLMGASMVIDDIFSPDPPRVDTTWAGAARGVTSPDLNIEDDSHMIAEYDDGDERDTNEFCDLDDDENLGDVVVELEKGVYLLEDATRLLRPKSVVIRGKGPQVTRLILDTESTKSLRIKGAQSVRIEGLTVVGMTGDGIEISECPEVVVEDAHFAGAMHGLLLRDCVATIGSSVFAGNQRGIVASKRSKVKIMNSAFEQNWEALRCRNGGFEIESSVFLENRKVIRGTIDHRTSISNSVLFGKRQEAGWAGRMRLATNNLVHFRHLGEEMGKRTNREIQDMEHFPDGVRWPEGFDVVPVHLAVFRMEKRGESDAAGLIDELRRQRAQVMAQAAQNAIREHKFDAARRLSRIAMRYWGSREIKDAPTELKEVAALAK